MAGFEFDFDFDEYKNLVETDVEEIMRDCLKEAAPILETNMKRQARASVMHSGDSPMVNSIKAGTVRKGKSGKIYLFVGLRESDEKGWGKGTVYKGWSGYSADAYSDHTFNRRNREGEVTHKYLVSHALKAIWLEHGIAGPTHHQPARPFLQASVNASKERVLQKMQEAYNRKVGGT